MLNFTKKKCIFLLCADSQISQFEYGAGFDHVIFIILKFGTPLGIESVQHILMHIVSNFICITLYYVILWCIFRI